MKGADPGTSKNAGGDKHCFLLKGITSCCVDTQHIQIKLNEAAKGAAKSL